MILIQDPATPDIISALWKEFKNNSVGYLGTKSELFSNKNKLYDDDNPKTFRDENVKARDLDD